MKHVDLIAATLAALWALVIWGQPEESPHRLAVAMARLCSPEMAAGFAAAAGARWYARAKAAAGIAAALLLGCTTIPVQPVHPSDEPLVEDAAALLGYGVRWSEHGIPVDVLDERPGEHAGEARLRVCQPEVEAIRDVVVMAHELGHALWLGHHGDPANVMHAYVARDTTDLDRDQRRTMRLAATWHRACERAQERRR
jgi:hypothetical protein